MMDRLVLDFINTMTHIQAKKSSADPSPFEGGAAPAAGDVLGMAALMRRLPGFSRLNHAMPQSLKNDSAQRDSL